MPATAAPSQEAVKRRQAVQVSLFLVAVGGATAALFYFVHGDLVAFRRGEQSIARANFTDAARDLGEAWSRGYRTPHVRLDLARALMESGRNGEALSLYLQALTLSPRDESLLETVSGIYQAQGRPEAALALYARLGPPVRLSVRALTRLGDLQQQAGNYTAAIAAFQLAAERAPRISDLQLRLGIVLSWMGRRAEAITALRSAIALDPDQRQAQLHLARVLLWDGRFAEAVTEYRRVLPP